MEFRFNAKFRSVIGVLECLMASVDVIVRAVALRWYDNAYPGWVEVAITDSRRNQHRIVEKAPVLTSLVITRKSAFPFDLWLHAEMEDIEGDEVRVSLKHDVVTVDGTGKIVVSAGDVVWL